MGAFRAAPLAALLLHVARDIAHSLHDELRGKGIVTQRLADGRYVIMDGLHRACMLKKRAVREAIILVVNPCPYALQKRNRSDIGIVAITRFCEVRCSAFGGARAGAG